MFTKLLIVSFLIATIRTTWAESTACHNQWLERQKRDTGEQQRRVVYGINSREMQNNFRFIRPAGNGANSNPGVSVVTGPNLDQSENSFSNINQAQSVYVVLPRWYEIKNYQAPSPSQRSRGDRISSERRQIIQRTITFLRRKYTALTNDLNQLLRRNDGLNSFYEEPNEKRQEQQHKLSVLVHKNRTLLKRLDYQQERLNLFNSDIPGVLQDIFDRDIGHLTLLIELTQLEVLALKNSFND